MPCPTCGGSDRDPIAPGYWRCTSLRLVVEEFGGPGLTNPFAGPMVIRREHLVPCETEYHEGAAASMDACACGTFAIGRCMECDLAVCGSHSALWEGRRLCVEHRDAAHAASEASREELRAREGAQAAAHAARAWGEWLDAARAELARSADPAERVVRVVCALSGGSWPERDEQDRRLLLMRLLPEQFADRTPDVPYWWDHDAVAAWFLGAVKAPPEDLGVVRFRRTVFGGSRREETHALGWSFPSGSTISRGGPSPSTLHWLDVSVLADGRRALGANVDDGPGVGFNQRALKLMFERAELDLLPPFPTVGMRHPQTGARVWPVA